MPVNTYFPTSYTLGTNGSNFINPGNLYSDNGVYSTVTQTTKNTTSQIYLEGFGITDIPSGSTINSVTIKVDRKMSTTASAQSVAIQAYNSSTAMGTKATSTAEPTTDTVYSSTTTGSWTVATLSGLRVLLENIRGNSTTACTISYDYVSVEVDFTAPSYDFSGSVSISSTSIVENLVSKQSNDSTSISFISNISLTGKLNSFGIVEVPILISSIDTTVKHGGFDLVNVGTSSAIDVLGVAYVSFDRTGNVEISSQSTVNVQVSSSKSVQTNIYALTGFAALAQKNIRGIVVVNSSTDIILSVRKQNLNSLDMTSSSAVINLGTRQSVGFFNAQASAILEILGEKYEQLNEFSGIVQISVVNEITLYGLKNGFCEADISSAVEIELLYAIGTSERIIQPDQSTVVQKTPHTSFGSLNKVLKAIIYINNPHTNERGLSDVNKSIYRRNN